MSPSVLQNATNQLINSQTLDILAHVDQLATGDVPNNSCNNNHINNNNNNNSSALYAVKSDPDDSDNDNEPQQQHQPLVDAEPSPLPLPLLGAADVAFTLHAPSAALPAYLNAYYVCECGSRLLFLSVHWVKQLPAFRRLSDDTQQALLLRSWTALFVLGLAQCAGTLALPTIWRSMAAAIRADLAATAAAAGDDGGGESAVRSRCMAEAVAELQMCVQLLVECGLDDFEFAYVKLVAMFGMGE